MNLPDFAVEYLPILVFIGIAFGLASVILLANFIVSIRKPYKDKLTAYECGFDAFADTRDRFDVRFYLVSILFTLFDLEIAFLFPWAVGLESTGVFGFWSMMTFLGILAVGFVYEWKKGALEWE